MTAVFALVRQLRATAGFPVYPLLFFIAIFAMGTSFAFAKEASVVIVNESVQKNTLTRSELRQIFTGHLQYWSDGTKIHVFVLDDSQILHKDFCRDNLQMFPYQLSRLWNQLTYSGQGVTPSRVPTQDALIRAVENTVGAIGYMDKKRITKANQLEVREQ